MSKENGATLQTKDQYGLLKTFGMAAVGAACLFLAPYYPGAAALSLVLGLFSFATLFTSNNRLPGYFIGYFGAMLAGGLGVPGLAKGYNTTLDITAKIITDISSVLSF